MGSSTVRPIGPNRASGRAVRRAGSTRRRIPPLRLMLDDEAQAARLIRCEDLEIQTVTDAGRTAEPKRFLYDAGDIYWLDGQDDIVLLGIVSDQFGLGLTADDGRRNSSRSMRSNDGGTILSGSGSARTTRRPALLRRSARRTCGVGFRRASGCRGARLAASATNRSPASRSAVCYGVDVLKAFRGVRRSGVGSTDSSGRAAAVHGLSSVISASRLSSPGSRRRSATPFSRWTGQPTFPAPRLPVEDRRRGTSALYCGEGGRRGLISLPDRRRQDPRRRAGTRRGDQGRRHRRPPSCGWRRATS